MPRGKPFICWLDGSLEPLCQGDRVLYRIKKRWWQGIIRKHKGDYCYTIHIGKRQFKSPFFRFRVRQWPEGKNG